MMIYFYNKELIKMNYYYGYNRVSTKDQNPQRGNDNIMRFCKEHDYP